MNITISISTTDLSTVDKTLIKECLGLTTDIELSDALKKLSKAAFMEYIKMFKEKGLPTRADEVQQERLFFLLNHYFGNRLPGENEISSIFQLTPSQSRTLLRNTKSRYRTKINNFIKNTLLTTLNSATQPIAGEQYEFVCTSPSTVEELNSIVTQKGPTLQPIEKIRGLASKYSCAVDTYNLLQTELI
ncbi:MAG: hypothetical protein ACTHOB_18495 [Ginsengibacter sp.]